MKNLENFKTMELSYSEMNETNGGNPVLVAIIVVEVCVLAFEVGVIAGYLANS